MGALTYEQYQLYLTLQEWVEKHGTMPTIEQLSPKTHKRKQTYQTLNSIRLKGRLDDNGSFQIKDWTLK